MGVAYNSRIVTDGLVLCLDAANRKSYPTTGTVWTDLSGNGNNGTLTNMDGTNFDSANGGSLEFNGSNEFVPIGSTGFPTSNSAGTLSAWARTNTITGGFVFIVSYGGSTTNAARFLGITNTSGGNPIPCSFLFGGYANDITASGVPLNTWFNMAGVYTGTNASMYVNGVLVSGPTAKSWNTNSGNANIGRQTNGNEYWNGNISQVSIYNRALTAAEIAQNYDALKGRYGLT